MSHNRRKLRYILVDVFTDQTFGGNQLAVFTNGRGVPAEMMQRIARELNLSESTFVLPSSDPANDYHVRIFTPAAELPMAGHPTVGTAFVLARENLVESEQIRFEEGVGVIPVQITVDTYGAPQGARMTQPLPRFGPVFEDRAAVAELLSLSPESLLADYPIEVVSCGVPFLFVPLRDLEAIRSLRLRVDIWEQLLKHYAASDIFVFTLETEREGSTVHSRMFAPRLGIAEDPATGAASGPLGSYLVHHGLVQAEMTTRIIGEQGFEMGRPSIIEIEIDRNNEASITGVRVGGRSVYMGEGYLEVEL